MYIFYHFSETILPALLETSFSASRVISFFCFFALLMLLCYPSAKMSSFFVITLAVCLFCDNKKLIACCVLFWDKRV